MGQGEMDLSELLRDRTEVVKVNETEKVREAIDSLLAAGGFCLAVMNSASSGECLALVTLFDLVNHTVTFIHKEGMGRTEEEINLMIRDRLNDTMAALLELRDPGPPFTIPMVQLDVAETAEKALTSFTKDVSGIVVTQEGKLVNVLTERGVLHYLWNHMENFDDDPGKSIEQLRVYKGPSKVLVMYEDRPAITGYALMAIHGVKSMPIVGLDTKMTTSLGEADLLRLAHSNYKKLALPVLEFLEMQSAGNERPPHCKKSTSLRELMGLMLETNLSRVWVLDDNRRVVGSVSAVDVINRFAAAVSGKPNDSSIVVVVNSS